MILDDIIEHKRGEVNEAKRRLPLAALQEQATVHARGEFGKAISVEDRTCLIAEVKKASPSRGTLCESFNPYDIARKYAHGGASAISVLTDAKFFQGHVTHLMEAREGSLLPALRKDFIIDEYQIWESAVIGVADAILLIVAALSAEQLRDYLDLSAELGLDALVEIHDAAQLDTALEAGAEIIGINNRDLKTFETSLEVTLKLAPMVPAGHIIVSESGIRTREDVLRVREAGANSILVGEALMTSGDIPAKIRELVGD
ncbi:MAG: indole-3-glycerol phosphate synthase TrpC [Candidatus Lindowbacteria bacterium]|nr:indole-3-glycerol phosphate synthase TrpC [Candidatus Lindowbacteria bacterium]